MKTLQQIKRKADSLRASLQHKPICENFGEREVRNLDAYIGDVYAYPWRDRPAIIRVRDEFSDWCMNFTGAGN